MMDDDKRAFINLQLQHFFFLSGAKFTHVTHAILWLEQLTIKKKEEERMK